MQESPSHKRFLAGCSSPFMRLAQHLTSLRNCCNQCLSGRWKPDVPRPGIVRMRRSMVIRLRPCMKMSTTPLPTHPSLPLWFCLVSLCCQCHRFGDTVLCTALVGNNSVEQQLPLFSTVHVKSRFFLFSWFGCNYFVAFLFFFRFVFVFVFVFVLVLTLFFWLFSSCLALMTLPISTFRCFRESFSFFCFFSCSALCLALMTLPIFTFRYFFSFFCFCVCFFLVFWLFGSLLSFADFLFLRSVTCFRFVSFLFFCVFAFVF